MKRSFGTKLLLWKTDFFSVFSDRKKDILLYTITLIIGVGVGVYIGIKLGAQEEPFGVISRIFRLKYTPFSYFLSELLRFSVFAFIAEASFFFPCYPLFPAFSLFFFGKHFAESACLAFLSDSITAAILTTFLTIIPLILVGGILLIRIALFAPDFRVCDGGFFCKNNLKRFGYILFCSIVVYLILLFAVYLLLCGILYLLIVAL